MILIGIALLFSLFTNAQENEQEGDVAIKIRQIPYIQKCLDSLGIDSMKVLYASLPFGNIQLKFDKTGYGIYKESFIFYNNFKTKVSKYLNVEMDTLSMVKLADLFMGLFVVKKYRYYIYRRQMPRDTWFEACPGSFICTWIFKGRNVNKKSINLGDIYANKTSNGRYNFIYSKRFKLFMQCIDYIGCHVGEEGVTKRYNQYIQEYKNNGDDVMDINQIINVNTIRTHANFANLPNSDVKK